MDEHGSFIGNFVTAHPEILLSLLIPVAHYGWNRFKNKYNTRNRKKSLRQQIADLLKQRESLAKVAEIEHGHRVLEDLENDLKAVIAALLPAPGESAAKPGTSRRNPAVRWLLLYKPSGAASWTLHVLFFLNVVWMCMGVISAIAPWSADSSSILIGVAVFLIPAYFFAALAHYVERKRQQQVAPA